MTEKIILNSDGIKSLKNLLSLCPDTFSSVPVKFIKEDGVSFISIEVIDINGDIVFSGKTLIDDIADIEDNSGLIIRLPLNRGLINNILSNFEELIITKNKITAKSPNKKLTMSLFLIDENDIFEFPHTNTGLYELAVTENSAENSKFVAFDPDLEQIKELLDTISFFSDLELIEFKEKNNKLIITSGDIIGNEFEFRFDVDVEPGFTCKFDTNLVKVLSKVIKYKNDDSYGINFLISDLLFGITLENDKSLVTLAVTARRD